MAFRVLIIGNGQANPWQSISLLGFQYGGFCFKGSLVEDGIISSKYNLTELDIEKYFDRILKNVIMSDGTLILHLGGIYGDT